MEQKEGVCVWGGACGKRRQEEIPAKETSKEQPTGERKTEREWFPEGVNEKVPKGWGVDSHLSSS